jgi:hypothetical protein
MSIEPISILALIVSDDTRAKRFEQTFGDLLEDAAKPTLKTKLQLERFKSVGDFIKAQRERKNLNGIILDNTIANEGQEAEKRAISLLEELQIPTLKVAEKMITGDAVDRKILTGKWIQLMDQVEAFAPRGLRVYPRKLCFVKIRYMRPSRRPGEEGKQIDVESKAITYDLSLGGCFIVSMENWEEIKTVSIWIGDFAEPVECDIAWKLPWGANPWKMPGIGVEFKNISENLRKYLMGFLKEA